MVETKYIVLGAVFIVGLFLFLGLSGVLQSSLGGYQILSLSQASIINDGKLGQSWLVTVSSIPNAFTINGKVSSTDVAAKSGQTPISDFDIYMSVDQQLKFPITDSNEVIYDYYMTPSEQYFCLATTSARDDPNAWLSQRIKYAVSTTCQTFNVYRVQHGKVGILQAQASIPSKITVKVTANGKTSSSTIIDTESTLSSQDLYVNGQRLGRVDWAGDLVNSAQPRPELFQQYKPINKDGQWYFTSMNAYNNYDGLNSGDVFSNIVNCFNVKGNSVGFKSSTGVSYFSECIAQYHSAYTSMTKQSVSGLEEITADSKSQIYATFTADKLYVFPQLTFLLDVDWVGIKVNKGTPDVLSASSSLCTSGQRGKVSTTVKNVGNGMGAFDVSMSCPGTSVLTSVQSDNYQPEESKILYFDFDMNVAQRTSQTCTIKAVDKGSFISDSKTVTVICDPAKVCIAGEEYCDGSVRKVCNSEGSAFSIKTNDLSCKEKNDTNMTCSALAGGLIPANPGVQSSCGIGCLALKGVTFGLVDTTKTTATCVYDWTLVLILFGAIILILAAIIIIKSINVKGSKVKKEKSAKIRKWTWIVAGSLVVIIVFLIFIQKLLPWIISGIIVLALAMAIIDRIKHRRSR